METLEFMKSIFGCEKDENFDKKIFDAKNKKIKFEPVVTTEEKVPVITWGEYSKLMGFVSEESKFNAVCKYLKIYRGIVVTTTFEEFANRRKDAKWFDFTKVDAKRRDFPATVGNGRIGDFMSGKNFLETDIEKTTRLEAEKADKIKQTPADILRIVINMISQLSGVELPLSGETNKTNASIQLENGSYCGLKAKFLNFSSYSGKVNSNLKCFEIVEFLNQGLAVIFVVLVNFVPVKFYFLYGKQCIDILSNHADQNKEFQPYPFADKKSSGKSFSGGLMKQFLFDIDFLTVILNFLRKYGSGKPSGFYQNDVSQMSENHFKEKEYVTRLLANLSKHPDFKKFVVIMGKQGDADINGTIGEFKSSYIRGNQIECNLGRERDDGTARILDYNYVDVVSIVSPDKSEFVCVPVRDIHGNCCFDCGGHTLKDLHFSFYRDNSKITSSFHSDCASAFIYNIDNGDPKIFFEKIEEFRLRPRNVVDVSQPKTKKQRIQ